jgi:hypothetical protein
MAHAMIRIFNDNLGRILHFTLYQRLYNFCVKYSPEFPADIAVNSWMNRLYTSDMNLHILAEVDENYKITEHALIDVANVMNHKVIYCHQMQHDTPSVSHATELMEYIDKLREHESAVASIFSMSSQKLARAVEKKYGYSILRTVLIKTGEVEDSDG